MIGLAIVLACVAISVVGWTVKRMGDDMDAIADAFNKRRDDGQTS